MNSPSHRLISSLRKCAAAVTICGSLIGCVATTSGYAPGLTDGVLTARYGTDLPITVYYPKNSTASAHPVVIFNHGRSFRNWQSGQLTFSRESKTVSILNGAGYAVAVPVRSGYHSAGGQDGERITCNHPFKSEFQDAASSAGRDINAAIQMVGGLDKIDSNRMAVLGYSAGGYAVLANMNSFPSAVRAVISLHGGRCGKRGPMTNGIEYGAEFVRASAGASTTPILFISGSRDSVIPTESVRHFRDEVCEARGAACKDTITMTVVEGANHGVANTLTRMDGELINFLNSALGPAR